MIPGVHIKMHQSDLWPARLVGRLSSGKPLHNYGNIHHVQWELTISMDMFNKYAKKTNNTRRYIEKISRCSKAPASGLGFVFRYYDSHCFFLQTLFDLSDHDLRLEPTQFTSRLCRLGWQLCRGRRQGILFLISLSLGKFVVFFCLLIHIYIYTHECMYLYIRKCIRVSISNIYVLYE